VGDAPIKVWVIGVYCSFACESKVFPFHVWYHFKCLSAINFITVIGNRKKIENLGESCSPPGVMSVFNSREEMCLFRVQDT